MTPDLQTIVKNIEDRVPLAPGHAASAFHADLVNARRELYRNSNARLGIDFSVDVIAFPGIQAFDPRVVRIAPGCNNELHKHAHESLFVVISGKAEVRIGDEALVLEPGGLAFVPRWAFHQSRNLSADEELMILAITDFGLTKAVLGDYDKRTRLSAGGADVIEHT